MRNKRNAKGEGSFSVNEDGTVTHRKSVGFKANGNRKVLTVTEANKAACIREMRKKELEWQKQKERGDIQDKTTVEELCNSHLQYQIEQDELKPKSVDRRECTIANHIGAYPLGKMQLHAVKVKDVDAHINGLIQEGKLSYSSIEKVVDVLNAAYNWAMARGELSSNPVAPIKGSLSKRIQKLKNKTASEADVVVLSDEEAALFEQEALRTIEKTGRRKYAAGLYGVLLLHTGMRCGEMLALRWRDVDFENGLLTIEKSRSVAKNRQAVDPDATKYIVVEGTTKNEKAREIELKPKALDILRILKSESPNSEEDDLIVTTRTGKPNTATNLEHRVAVIFKNAGLTDYTGGLHIFRRTFATQMYDEGARVADIAAYIGDLESTTQRYYIASRKKLTVGGQTKQIVKLPKRVDWKDGAG
jgi:integrase